MLLHELEKNAEVLTNLPSASISSTWVVNGMALIQRIRGSKAKTFGELAQKLFEIIQNIMSRPTVTRVDVAFDRYDQEMSIKSLEQQRRTTDSGYEVKIHNINTPLPKQWNKFLLVAINKASFSEA